MGCVYGSQSGTESLTSMLIVPLNGLLILQVPSVSPRDEARAGGLRHQDCSGQADSSHHPGGMKTRSCHGGTFVCRLDGEGDRRVRLTIGVHSRTVSVRGSRLGLSSGWRRCSLSVTQFPNDPACGCLSSDLSGQRPVPTWRPLAGLIRSL